MRIGLFFASFEGGGAERMMINLAKGLHKLGFDIRIYVVNNTGPYIKEVPEHIQVVNFDAKFGVKSIIYKIRKVLKVDMLDIMVSTQMHVNAAVGLASIGIINKPILIFREANIPSKLVGSFVKKMIYRFSYSHADHFVSVSNGVKKSMLKYYSINKDKIDVIYNPVIDDTIDSKMNHELSHPWFIEGDIPVIVAVGRISPQKSFEDLIDAFISLREDNIFARLVIIGRKNKHTDYFKFINNKINQSKYSNDIQLLGFVNNPFKYLKNADLFVLSSKFEGLPSVLIQAMACGCPVVSTDCPSGPREILDDGKYGKLVEVGDTNWLKKEIMEMLSNPINKEVVIRRSQYFSIDNAVEKYLNLFKKLSEN